MDHMKHYVETKVF